MFLWASLLSPYRLCDIQEMSFGVVYVLQEIHIYQVCTFAFFRALWLQSAKECSLYALTHQVYSCLRKRHPASVFLASLLWCGCTWSILHCHTREANQRFSIVRAMQNVWN